MAVRRRYRFFGRYQAQIVEEFREGILRFAYNIWSASGSFSALVETYGPPTTTFFSVFMCQLDHIFERFLLNDHRTGEYHVSPLNVIDAEFFGIHVPRADAPNPSEASPKPLGDQRRKGCLFSLEFQSVTETPVRVRNRG